jgi:tripartite ATP-independent transporter DctM subunit
VSVTSATTLAPATPIAKPPARADGGLMHAVDALAVGLVVAALLAEVAIVLGNVAARLFFRHSFLWADEAARLALSVLAFVGGAVAYRRRQHAFVRVLLGVCPRGVEAACLALADVLVLFCALALLATSLAFIGSSWSERTPILQWPAATIALPLPVGMALMAVYALVHLRREHGLRGLYATLGLVATLAALAATGALWRPWFAGDTAIFAVLAFFLAAIFAGVPVGFVLLLATAAYVAGTGAASMVVLPQSMVNGTGNFILLAVPFFILAGLVMERGGISTRLVRFIKALVGHVRGGLLQVAVVSMYLVSGLSGSKPADVAAVGTVMRDELRERHGEAEGAAVLAASAVMGETVPPSIAMLIVGSITSVSVAGMFIAGLVPAAVMAAGLVLLIHWRARRDPAPPAPRTPRATMLRAARGAILPLLLPGLLLGGILFGVATPTEVAAFAVVYGVALATFVYREMRLVEFMRVVGDAAALTGVLLFIFAAASGFSWTLTIAYLPQRLVDLLHSVGNSNAIFMLGSIVLLVVVGVLLEGLPSLNVLAPLLLPIAGKLGLSELHYALVLIIAMGVGGFMPLAGIGFYVCCAVMRCDIESASRAMLPYLGMVIAGLLVVAFVPALTLFLPHYFGFRG